MMGRPACVTDGLEKDQTLALLRLLGEGTEKKNVSIFKLQTWFGKGWRLGLSYKYSVSLFWGTISN